MTTTYSGLVQRLNSVMQTLERDNVSIDEIETLLASGFEIISTLREKLTQTEAKIENIVNSRLTKETLTNNSEDPLQ